jgi:hypothetical protein
MAALAPPTAILTGVRAARGVEGAEISGPPTFIEAVKRWAINVSVDAGPAAQTGTAVSRLSEWFVVAEPSYPLGSISVYPSKGNSVTTTFQHQELNSLGPADRPWRNGKLCLDTPASRFGRIALGPEPLGDCEERLRWHVTRAVAWVRAAAAGTLIQAGDPFELPCCPAFGEDRIVHDESPSSFDAWSRILPGDWGSVIWDTVGGIEKTIVATAFTTRDGTLVRATTRYREHRNGSRRQDHRTGLWWLWPSPIVLEPWQIPLTWADLRSAGKGSGIDVDAKLQEIAPQIRGRNATILLLGYPIPRLIGDAPTEVQWQAVRIPKLEIEAKAPKGFRPSSQTLWQRDRRQGFAENQRLVYVPTANWHPDRLQARGRLRKAFCDARVAIVGCGALGSEVAELLVRGGVADVLLIDNDCLAPGNLVRHTLSGQDLFKNKATALAERLTSAAPFSSVRAYTLKIPTVRADIEALLDDRNVVIDCTAADDVLFALALGWWSLSRLFVSASVGYEAKRTFVVAHRGHSFPPGEFRRRLEPMLRDERALWVQRDETLEGPGCWSPLFPARMDDVVLSAASCVKVIEELVTEIKVETKLVVFEQVSEGGFAGLRRLELSQEGGEGTP